MAYSQAKKQEALEAYKACGNTREVSRRVNVPHSTVQRWVEEAEATVVVSPPEAGSQAAASPASLYPGHRPDGAARLLPSAVEERDVTTALLAKSRAMLEGIEVLEPKERSDTATAVDKLLGKYLALLGRSEQQVIVKERESGLTEEDMDELAVLLGLQPVRQEVEPAEGSLD